jgi:hypothetical protein
MATIIGITISIKMFILVISDPICPRLLDRLAAIPQDFPSRVRAGAAI